MSTSSWMTDFYNGSVFSPFTDNPSSDQHQIIFQNHMKKLTELATTRFKWVDLPDSIDPRFLEDTLHYNGLSIFFKHKKNDGYLAMRGTPEGLLDAQNNPTGFTLWGNNAELFGGRYDADKCVPIWSNYVRWPDHHLMIMYANRLTMLDVSFEMVAINSRQPVLLTVDERQKLSVENIYRGVQEGQMSMGVFKNGAVNDGGPGDKISALDLGVSAVDLDRYQAAKNRVMNEIMSILGINNANMDKKERLVEDEVSANDSQVSHYRNTVIKPRQEACERINKMFPDLNVSVEWDEDAAAPEQEEIEPIQEVNNGQVHNDATGNQ